MRLTGNIRLSLLLLSQLLCACSSSANVPATPSPTSLPATETPVPATATTASTPTPTVVAPTLGSPMPASPSANGGTRIAEGAWGGEHAQMMVTSGGASVEFDCA